MDSYNNTMTTQSSIQPHQGSTQSLSLNTSTPSSNTSPETSQGNIVIPSDGRSSSHQGSPVNLASSINGLSLESQGQMHSPPDQPTYTIKVKNVPNDISPREAHALFAFAKDFVGAEVIPDSSNMPVIYARFKSLSSASSHSQALESTHVFGPSHPYFLKAEIQDPSFHAPLSLGSASKRPSIGNQRSRFLFSDPFSNEPISENSEQQTSAGPPNTGSSNGVGKSLLLMESQQDAREYEQLVRDPWSQPQVPRSQPPSSSSASFSGPSAPSSAPYGNSQPQTPGVEWDRRRQSSAFFNKQSPLLAPGQIPPSQLPPQMSLNQPSQQIIPPSQQLGAPTGPQSVNGPPLNQGLSIPPQAAQVSQPLAPQPSQISQPLAPQSSQTSLGVVPQAPSAQSTIVSSNQSSQVDLSILARVPPPANPADQNPPCNTLYVGNLPPDATEAELRQLFSPQRGFRRLSFRTKQANGATPGQSPHSHGPMCFVEFEDVAHATRALAELYGRTLPRPGGVPGKGGIRLSFSKNPLGVRGPGQRRASGFQYQGGFKN